MNRQLEPAIYSYNPDNEKVSKWKLPEHIGSMALREKGEAVLALRNGFHFFDFESGKCELIIDPEAEISRSRSLHQLRMIPAHPMVLRLTAKGTFGALRLLQGAPFATRQVERSIVL